MKSLIILLYGTAGKVSTAQAIVIQPSSPTISKTTHGMVYGVEEGATR